MERFHSRGNGVKIADDASDDGNRRWLGQINNYLGHHYEGRYVREYFITRGGGVRHRNSSLHRVRVPLRVPNPHSEIVKASGSQSFR